MKVYNVTFAQKIAQKLSDGSYGKQHWIMIEDSITDQELSEVSVFVDAEHAYLRLSGSHLCMMASEIETFDSVCVEVTITDTKD